MKFGISPDFSVLTKAISSGYPCAAVIGKGGVMQAAQQTFISSTYWTERVGSIAALATIKTMISQNVPERLYTTGLEVQKIWKESAKNEGLDMEVEGNPSLCHFTLKYPENQILHTIITQQLLTYGILGSTAFYASYAHSAENLSLYKEAFKNALKVVSDAIESKKPESFLSETVAQKGFARL